jgi:hypothetical protein
MQEAVKLEQSIAHEPLLCPVHAVQETGGTMQSSSSLQLWREEDCEDLMVHSLPSQGNVKGGPSVKTQVFCSQETVVLPQVREQEATVPLQDEQVDSGIGQSEVSWHCMPVEDRDELVQAPTPQARVKFPDV